MIWETPVSLPGKQKIDFLKEIVGEFDFLELTDFECFTDDIEYNALFSTSKVMIPADVGTSNYFELAFWNKNNDRVTRVHLDTKRITCEIHGGEDSLFVTKIHRISKEMFRKYFIGAISAPNFDV